MFSKMPYMLVALITALFFLNPIIPLELKGGLYAISLTIKEIIITVLPVIIFGLLFNSAVTLSKGGTRIIFLILALVVVSSFMATFAGQTVGHFVYGMDLSLMKPSETSGLQPLWHFKFDSHIPNHYALLAGLALGIFAGKFAAPIGEQLGGYLTLIVNKLLKGLTFAIPLFIAGFVVKLNHDGLLITILKDYSWIFAIILVAQFGYIAFAFLAMTNFRIKEFLENIKNLIPAIVTGFSTMSSAATMPLTLLAVEANAKQKELAKSVVPVTTNNHMLGDCIAIIIFAFAILKNFGAPEPTMGVFMLFAFYFVVAKFTVAGIPGGGILAVLPALENYLGFSTEMLSLATALYILFDPVITVGNILGNAAFAKMIDRIVTHSPEELPAAQTASV